MSKFFLKTILIAFFVFFALSSVQAQISAPELQVDIDTVQLSDAEAKNGELVIPWINEYVVGIYRYGIGIVGVVAAFVLMYAGVVWLTAAGNQSRVSQAKTLIVGSLSGLVIALSSYMILYYINPELVSWEPLTINVPKPPPPKGCCTYTNDNTESDCENTISQEDCRDLNGEWTQQAICKQSDVGEFECVQATEERLACFAQNMGTNCSTKAIPDGYCKEGMCVCDGINSPCTWWEKINNNNCCDGLTCRKDNIGRNLCLPDTCAAVGENCGAGGRDCCEPPCIETKFENTKRCTDFAEGSPCKTNDQCQCPDGIDGFCNASSVCVCGSLCDFEGQTCTTFNENPGYCDENDFCQPCLISGDLCGNSWNDDYRCTGQSGFCGTAGNGNCAFVAGGDNVCE